MLFVSDKKATIMSRFGQSRIHTPNMTVYVVISRPNIPYIHHIYI
jgi:hypothetical protein